MTRPTRITAALLREAAEVARETGTCIVIEAGGKVVRIAPTTDAFPITASEKDQAACDEAFGTGRSA